jgi:hypothetical protein
MRLPVYPVHKVAGTGSTGQTGRKQQTGQKEQNRLYSCVLCTMSFENQWFAKMRVGRIPLSPPLKSFVYNQLQLSPWLRLSGSEREVIAAKMGLWAGNGGECCALHLPHLPLNTTFPISIRAPERPPGWRHRSHTYTGRNRELLPETQLSFELAQKHSVGCNFRRDCRATRSSRTVCLRSIA